ncbi:type I-E CRISPR-associated protein Cse1/CasA [Streptomyces nodosus]|uniref:type I-E CRISPR-associated protein Cse1/CasA n=1 Tax=Streptomyces nodosus TaxID=40318 RepID=UPI003451AB11
MTGPTWSLADRPWIDVLDLRGRRDVLSLAAVLRRAGQVHLAASDPLLWAATLRLLVTIAYTAGCAPADQDGHQRNVVDGVNLAPAATWVRDHAAELDLFGPRPLFQDAALHAIAGEAGATVPVLYLDMTAAIGRPLLVDHRHLYASLPVTARRAAELLLIQQMWAIGGRISAKDAFYGAGCNFGRSSCACGGLVWHPVGTVAQMLAWRLMPLPEFGIPQWTYHPRGEGTGEVAVNGEADALTWHHRRMLLLRDGSGMIDRVLFAQGWRMARQPDVPACLRPGSRDVVDTGDGRSLSATTVTGESDIAPVLERWWQAPEGSWAHAARQVITATGRAPDLVTVGLATKKKKILHQRRIHIPATGLTDPRSGSAVAAVMNFRRRVAQAIPTRRPVTPFNTVLPPGFGSDLLSQEQFLTVSDDQREAMLFHHARPAHGGDPVLNSRRASALAAATLTMPLPQSDPHESMQPNFTPTHSATSDDTDQRGISAIDGILITSPPGALPPLAEPEPVDDLDDEDLFTTADTPDATAPFTEEGIEADRRTDAGRMLATQLGRWATSPHTRHIMARLSRWAAQPSVSNRAYPWVTRNVPDQHHQAAMLVAALFAVHYRTNKSAPRYGDAPLPRLMRAFGSGTRYGPDHPATRTAVTHILRTTSIDRLRTPLLRQIRYAAANSMTPNWTQLFDDLAHWGPSVRDRWARLFFTAAPVPVVTASAPVPSSSAEKDPTST